MGSLTFMWRLWQSLMGWHVGSGGFRNGCGIQFLHECKEQFHFICRGGNDGVRWSGMVGLLGGLVESLVVKLSIAMARAATAASRQSMALNVGANRSSIQCVVGLL